MEYKVAMSSDFLDAFAALPRKLQSKMSTLATRFMANPLANGFNYEKLANGLWSIRVNDAYRVIVAREDATGVFVLLWVANHDDAYDWAKRKRVAVNGRTGALQVYTVEERLADEASVQTAQAAPAPGPFADFAAGDLLELGVPEELLAFVRGLADEGDFDTRGKEALPADAYEYLSWLANGFDMSDVLELKASEAPVEEVPSSMGQALDSDQSKRGFVVVDGEEELQRILAEPLDKWRVFLHPSQRKLVERDFRGPARVLGGAGTGKTVVAMHRARRLASALPAGERLLFTTYSTALSADISENLRKICDRETMRRIEVVNLDAWVARFMAANDFPWRIEYDEERLLGFWEEAMGDAGFELNLDAVYLADEWAKVIVANESFDLASYSRVRRPGRGRRLGRRERVQVWAVAERYLELVKEARVRDADYAAYECRRFIESMASAPHYASIVVDEGQDFTASEYRLLRALAGPQHDNDIFIAGDSQQRIYDRQAALSRCGIDIRGRGSVLKINYRTTEEIRRSASNLLAGYAFDDLDAGDVDTGVQSLTHGDAPELVRAATFDEEASSIAEAVRSLQDEGVALKDVCLAARTNSLVDTYATVLSNAGVETLRLKPGRPDDRNRDGVRLATMHRVKGLEFDHVVVAGVSRGAMPPARALSSARAAGTEEQLMRSERCLLYVALTRARKGAMVTYSGRPSEVLKEG